MQNINSENYKTAIFAGGCFWCMVSPFDVLDGIISVTSGYTGGELKSPTYKDVKAQSTGHYEAIKVVYDSTIISYEKLLEAFWRQIDPTDDEGQFQDRGSSYIAAIFYMDENQRIIAEKSKKALKFFQHQPSMKQKNIIKNFIKPILQNIKRIEVYLEEMSL